MPEYHEELKDGEGFPLVTAEPARVCPMCHDTIDKRDWLEQYGCCSLCRFWLFDYQEEVKP